MICIALRQKERIFFSLYYRSVLFSTIQNLLEHKLKKILSEEKNEFCALMIGLKKGDDS